MRFIWLPKEKYADKQESVCMIQSQKPVCYVVACIEHVWNFKTAPIYLSLDFCGDTVCYILGNGKVLCGTAAKCPGDFANPDRPMEDFYVSHADINLNEEPGDFVFQAMVQLSPTRLYDFSSGFGGFASSGYFLFPDGTKEYFEADDTWNIRYCPSFTAPGCYDGTKEKPEYVKAEYLDVKRELYPAKIRLPREQEIFFGNKFHVNARSTREEILDFPLIYSSYIELENCGDVLLRGTLEIRETEEAVSVIQYTLLPKERVRFFDLYSVGGLKLETCASGDHDGEICVHVYHVCYPYENLSEIETSDDRLRDLFSKCLYTCVNCSQTMFLDSPKHCEPLASCCGDYYIESLVTGYSSGDYTLAKHVLRGYAILETRNHGSNANLSYSLIFVQWLYHIYLLTGDLELLKDCCNGVREVINLFSSYVGPRGIIDHPAAYTFLDWLGVDGFSLFAPPAVLGQSAMNLFYYKALCDASSVMTAVCEDSFAKEYSEMAKKLKEAINKNLYNEEKGLYFEGRYDEIPEEQRSRRIPESPKKIYYRPHANILAVAYGVASPEDSKRILDYVMTEMKELEVQPYFLFFLFKAIEKCQMEGKYTMEVIKRYFSFVKEEDKGLPEGFYLPSGSYKFDFSHAWASSPYSAFMSAVLGLRILEPGMKKIQVCPQDLGVRDFYFEFGTPYGKIYVEKQRNQEVKIKVPDEIEVLYEK